MVENRFPVSGLSAEYGIIILTSVVAPVTMAVTVGGSVVLTEVYHPDTTGTVRIYDIGQLAMMYKPLVDLLLNDGADGGLIPLSISLTEGVQVITKAVTIYPCEVESAGTLTPTLLLKMPLSRVTKKTTGAGRTEYISFYQVATILKAYVVKKTSTVDVAVTVNLATLTGTGIYFYRVNVSPSVIAALAGCAVSDLVYYNVYSSTDAIIQFTMDVRNYPTQKTFVFRNSFGAQETFTCIATNESDRKWKREFGSAQKKQLLISKDLENKHTANTGFITRETVEVLEDLMNAEKVCLLDAYGLHDIVILGESFKVTDRRDELIEVNFDYRFASNNQLQTRYKPFAKPGIFDSTFDQTFN